jgi:hypothetical protein
LLNPYVPATSIKAHTRAASWLCDYRDHMEAGYAG